MSAEHLMVDDWAERLLEAINADGRTDRDISIAAGLGQNYVNQFRNGDRSKPKVKQIIKLADALGVSLTYLFLGADVTPEDERFVQLLRDSRPEVREAVLTLLQSRRTPASS